MLEISIEKCIWSTITTMTNQSKFFDLLSFSFVQQIFVRIELSVTLSKSTLDVKWIKKKTSSIGEETNDLVLVFQSTAYIITFFFWYYVLPLGTTNTSTLTRKEIYPFVFPLHSTRVSLIASIKSIPNWEKLVSMRDFLVQLSSRQSRKG